MPTVQGNDNFSHGNFTVPGGAAYTAVDDTPTKDTTILHAPDPASLLITAVASAVSVSNAISGLPTLPWHGYWYRVNAADEPVGDFQVQRLLASDAADGRLDFQVSTNRFFQYISGGAEFPTSDVYTFDTWVWIEHILDTSGGTRTQFTRIAGADLTPTNRVVAAATGTGTTLGQASVGTITARYSNHFWGVAASTSDWLGEPLGVQPSDDPPVGMLGRGAGW